MGSFTAKKAQNDRKLLLAVNETILWLNRSPLGCLVERVKSDRFYDYIDRREKNHSAESTNIRGTSKDGKAIYIERMVVHRGIIPLKKKRLFMRQQAALGAIVGCAYNYSDAWDIVSGVDRNPRTFNYERESNYGKGKKGSSSNDGGDEGDGNGSPHDSENRSDGNPGD